MEKYIAKYSFWLGLICVLAAVGWRGLNTMGIFAVGQLVPGQTVYYMSFYKGGLIFLLLSIAASLYGASKAEKS